MTMAGNGQGNRQRLRPWLINQINSGEYPGVSWIDKGKMAFKIPWKHFGKPGVNEERDAKIFREWARHTGKYRDGDPSDASTWKTRFRCALYKLQDIEELNQLNMLDGDEPYRVYRFRSKEEMELESKAFGGVIMSSPAPSSDDGMESESHYFPDRKEDLSILPDEDYRDFTENFCRLMGPENPDKFLTDISKSPLSTPVYPAQQPSKPVQLVPPIFTPSVDLKITLYNKSVEVSKPMLINNPFGCRLASNAPPPLPTDLASKDNEEVVSHIYGPPQAQQVYFPESDNSDTTKLLAFMKRGLVLQTNDNDIYATRLCQAKIFYATSQADDAQLMELQRENTTKVFDYKKCFMPQLDLALSGSVRPPRAELYFCFGQRWGDGTPLADNLVHARVTHMLAEQQLKSFFSRRYEVIISEPNNLDDIASQIDQLNVNGTCT